MTGFGASIPEKNLAKESITDRLGQATTRNKHPHQQRILPETKGQSTESNHKMLEYRSGIQIGMVWSDDQWQVQNSYMTGYGHNITEMSIDGIFMKENVIVADWISSDTWYYFNSLPKLVQLPICWEKISIGNNCLHLLYKRETQKNIISRLVPLVGMTRFHHPRYPYGLACSPVELFHPPSTCNNHKFPLRNNVILHIFFKYMVNYFFLAYRADSLHIMSFKEWPTWY